MHFLLQTVIALIFIYIISSIVNSLVVESLSQWINLRGDFLRYHLTNFFKVEKPKQFNPLWRIVYWFKNRFFGKRANQVKNFGDLIYDHFLMKKFSRKRKEYPNYIDPKLFSSVIYDLILKEIPKEKFAKLTIDDIPNPVHTDKEGNKGVVPIPDAIKEIIKNTILKASKLEKNLDDIALEIEQVYNIYMNRVTQWYKSQMKWILFAVGLLIASFSNLDTINLFKIIRGDTQVRDELFVAAEKLSKLETVELNDEQKEVLVAELVKKSLIKTDTVLLIYPPEINGETIGKVYQFLLKSDEEISPSFSNLELGPAGVKQFFNKEKIFENGSFNGSALWQWILKLMGLFVTAVALSYGATFWFDLLKKLIRFG